MSSRSIASRLESAHLALTNALAESDLLEALSAYGYDEARLLEGKSYYESALAHFHQQQEHQHRYRAASLAQRQADEAATQAYMHAVKLCRVICRKDPVAYRRLGLTGKRHKSFANRVVQMRLFYTAALDSPDILTVLSAYGLSEGQLQNELAQVAVLETAHAQRERENGAAQNATQTHQQALAELDRWMGEFVAIARLALAQTPQRLEMLGLPNS
ncbi:MAG: hypothetical protein WBO46_16740 [Caldilineaceae bacterium]